MKTIIEMAREAGFFVKDSEAYSPSVQYDHELTPYLERFAALVRADERELVLAAAIDGAEHAARKAVADEREACAKLCDKQAEGAYWEGADACAELIRARGQA